MVIPGNIDDLFSSFFEAIYSSNDLEVQGSSVSEKYFACFQYAMHVFDLLPAQPEFASHEIGLAWPHIFQETVFFSEKPQPFFNIFFPLIAKGLASIAAAPTDGGSDVLLSNIRDHFDDFHCSQQKIILASLRGAAKNPSLYKGVISCELALKLIFLNDEINNIRRLLADLVDVETFHSMMLPCVGAVLRQCSRDRDSLSFLLKVGPFVNF